MSPPNRYVIYSEAGEELNSTNDRNIARTFAHRESQQTQQRTKIVDTLDPQNRSVTIGKWGGIERVD